MILDSRQKRDKLVNKCQKIDEKYNQTIKMHEEEENNSESSNYSKSSASSVFSSASAQKAVNKMKNIGNALINVFEGISPNKKREEKQPEITKFRN